MMGTNKSAHNGIRVLHFMYTVYLRGSFLKPYPHTYARHVCFKELYKNGIVSVCVCVCKCKRICEARVAYSLSSQFPVFRWNCTILCMAERLYINISAMPTFGDTSIWRVGEVWIYGLQWQFPMHCGIVFMCSMRVNTDCARLTAKIDYVELKRTVLFRFYVAAIFHRCWRQHKQSYKYEINSDSLGGQNVCG